MRDIWAVWPDDFMCRNSEVEEYLQPPCARSDDYQLVEVSLYGPDDYPLEWSRYDPRQTQAPAPNA